MDLGKNRWCGAARRSHLVVVRVWKFGSLPSLVFHARRATAEPYRSTPRPQKAHTPVFCLFVPLPPPPAIRAMACVYSNCCVTTILP